MNSKTEVTEKQLTKNLTANETLLLARNILDPDSLQKLILCLNNSKDKVEVLSKLLEDENYTEIKFLQNLITPNMLVALASEDESLCKYILDSKKCMSILMGDPTQIVSNQIVPLEIVGDRIVNEEVLSESLIYICRKQATLVYSFLLQTKGEKQKIIANYINDNIKDTSVRFLLSNLLACYDQVDTELLNDQNKRTLASVYSLKADELIRGEDGARNLQIISRSRKLATELMRVHISSIYKHIPFEASFSIIKQYPDLVSIALEYLIYDVYNYHDANNKTTWINLLLPILEEQVAKDHKESKLILANILFFGLSQKGVDRANALKLCYSVVEFTINNQLQSRNTKVCNQLLMFAKALQTGKRFLISIPKDFYQSYSLFQYVATKAMDSDIRRDAQELLVNPSFLININSAEENFDAESIFKIYSTAQIGCSPKKKI